MRDLLMIGIACLVLGGLGALGEWLRPKKLSLGLALESIDRRRTVLQARLERANAHGEARYRLEDKLLELEDEEAHLLEEEINR